MFDDAGPRCLWAPWAWMPARGGGAWQGRVLLESGPDGCWQRIAVDQPCPPGAQALAGPALPGLVNGHSHAFQRAFAGLAERPMVDAGQPQAGAVDDFWSWRECLYAVANRVTPELLRAIATQLYIELIEGGYTQVCEFHYLQHRPDGEPYADPLELGWALADAADAAGIGLTLLPVLYERAGFDQPALRPEQRRFRSDAPSVLALRDGLRRAQRPLLKTGLAIHSLRAAAPATIAQLVGSAGANDGEPIHIHIAEQTAEVDACLADTGRRPIQWLADQKLLDRRWQLVHATHSVAAEIEAVAASGAGVVLCPGTEANLGDGLCDLSGWLTAGVPLSIGSDSQVTRSWTDELRLLDHGFRLTQRRRRPGAAALAASTSLAEALWARALAGGAAAAGFDRWGLEAGARADLLVAEPLDLRGVPPALTIDSLVACGPNRPWRDVMVAGRWVRRGHRHPLADAAGAAFAEAMRSLWAAATSWPGN